MSLRSEVYMTSRGSGNVTEVGCGICGVVVTCSNTVQEIEFLKEHRAHLAPIERIMEKNGIQCSDIDETQLRKK